MKKIHKTSCNTQSIKRFLSPQPSNIPCKKPRRTGVKIGPKSKVRGTCLAAQYEENCEDEMVDRKAGSNNVVAGANESQDSSTSCSSQHKFDWNSFVRDPGELKEARYPVTLNTFKTMTHSISIAKRILEDFKNATGVDFVSDQFMEERVLKNYYKQFYEQPQIRDMYKLETKACPVFVKKKIMQIPKLEGEAVATTVVQTEDSDVNKKASQIRPAEQVVPVVKPKEPMLPEVQSTKTQVKRVSQQSASSVPITNRGNIIYIPKGIALAESNFLLKHIRHYVQDAGKHQEILERIKSEIFQQTNHSQRNQSEQNVAEKVCVEEPVEVLSDITVSSQNTTTVNSATQRIQDAKELFFREYNKSNTLAYALRFHKGLRRRIIEAVLKMTFEEFKKYTRIHNTPEIYEDDELLGGFYDYAIKEPQMWPTNLYMPLSALFQFLKLKGLTLSDCCLEDVTPMLLHWSELAAKTDFDCIMRWDYYRCKGEKFNKTENLDVYRKAFYEKCWLHDIWVRKVPKIKKQAREILEKEAKSKMTIEETRQVQEEVSAAEAEVSNNEVEERAAVSKSDSAKVQNDLAAAEIVAESAIKLETDNVEPPKQINVENVRHTEEGNGDTEMQDLGDKLETLQVNNDKEREATSIEVIEVIKQETNVVVEEPASTQASTAALLVKTIVPNQNVDMDDEATTAQPCVTDLENSTLMETQAVVRQNTDSASQARLQKAIDLYFSEAEKSCTLPYLLRYRNGLNRHVIASILNMSFPEFKQYTHIYEAAEIYEDAELLKRCYEHTIKAPQVWPINLYMRLTDLFQYLKTKHVSLPEIGLKYISPKLLHWRNLISTTNYDNIVIWDYYRSTGNKINRSKTFLDPYRQTFYEKCWFYDKWIWYTPNILTKVLRCITNEQSSSAIAEYNESAIFERSVVLHAVEQVQETSATNVANEAISGGNETRESSECRLPRTVDTGIQTSQGLLGEYLNSVLQAATSSDQQNVENPATTVLPCQGVKTEKLEPLNKLQFNLTEDEDNYECVQAPDDIVDLDKTVITSHTQEQTLLAPLSNSETLIEHDINGLFSSGSVDISDLRNSSPAPANSQSQKSNELNSEQNQITLHQGQAETQQIVTEFTITTNEELDTLLQPESPREQEQQAEVVQQQSEKPIQQQQQTDKNLQHLKPQQASQVEQKPHFMRVKQEQAKAAKQQERRSFTTAVTQIIEEAKSRRQQTEQTMDIDNLRNFPAATDGSESQQSTIEQPSSSHQPQVSRVGEQKPVTLQRSETPIQQQRHTEEGVRHSKAQQGLEVEKQLTESQILQEHQSVEQLQEQPTQVETLAEQQQSSNTQSQLQPAKVCVEQQLQDQEIEAQLEVIFDERTEMQLPEVQSAQIQETATTTLHIQDAISEQQSSQSPMNRNDSTEAFRKIEIISQHLLHEPASQPEQSQQQQHHLQQQLAQPQLILQRTHTQVQEQLMLGPHCGLPQKMAIPLPPLAKLSQQPTTTSTCNTKTKTFKTTKAAAKRKPATKQSDFVPQLTHNFQPLPIALNTKKTPEYSEPSSIICLPTESNQTSVNLQQRGSMPAAGEQVITGNTVALSTLDPNTLVLSLPASMPSSSTNSSSNTSFMYTLSGDSTFFNSSELLRAIEHYQLQRSREQQQQQHLQQQQQQQQQQQHVHLQQPQHSQLVFGQSQIVQLPHQQIEQLHVPHPQQQQLEMFLHQHMEQPQRQQIHISQPLMIEHSSQQQQQQQHQQVKQQLQISQPLIIDSSSQQQQHHQQQQYQVVPTPQPVIYQLLDVTQVNTTTTTQLEDCNAPMADYQINPDSI